MNSFRGKPATSWTSRLAESWRTCHSPGAYLGLIVGALIYFPPAIIRSAVAGLRRPTRNG